MTNFEYAKYAPSEGKAHYFRRDPQNENVWQRLDLSEPTHIWVQAGPIDPDILLALPDGTEITDAIRAHEKLTRVAPELTAADRAEEESDTALAGQLTPKGAECASYYAAPNGTVYSKDNHRVWRSLSLASDGSFDWVMVPYNEPPEGYEAIKATAVFRLVRENRRTAKLPEVHHVDDIRPTATKTETKEERAARKRETYAYFESKDGADLYRVRPGHAMEILREYEPETRELWVLVPKGDGTPLNILSKPIEEALAERRTHRVHPMVLKLPADQIGKHFADIAADFQSLLDRPELLLVSPGDPNDPKSVDAARQANEAISNIMRTTVTLGTAASDFAIAAKSRDDKKTATLAKLRTDLQIAEQKVGQLSLLLEQKSNLVENLTDSLERARRAGFEE